MKKVLYWATILSTATILGWVCFSIGAYRNSEDTYKSSVDFFTIIGAWISGIGALAAAYVALKISDRQRQDIMNDEEVRSLHHMLATVNDLRGRVTYLRAVFVQGGYPLAALTNNNAAVMRRYETLWDRELYTYLPGPIIDQITNLSGSFSGIDTIVSIMSSQLGNNPQKTLPPPTRGTPRDGTPFDKLWEELDNLFTVIEQERLALSSRVTAGHA
jgi:hypothetical protein